MPRTHRLALVAATLIAAIAPLGCASYTTPGPAADMRLFGVATPEEREAGTDWQIRDRLALKPLAQFPTAIAVARVQGAGYESYTLRSHGRGSYSVVTTRDVEADEHFERLGRLPLVRGIAPLNRIVLPDNLRGDEDLRQAAAMLHADLLLIYTIDTHLYVGSSASPVDVVTFGFLPHKKARVHATASAALLDTRNGYIYGLAEGSADHDQLANAWTTRSAVDQARRNAESEAFDKLVGELENTWAGVVRQYGTATHPSASAAPPSGVATP